MAERSDILQWVDEATLAGARQSRACNIIGLSEKTLQRWRQPGNDGDGRLNRTGSPKNKLSEFVQTTQSI